MSYISSFLKANGVQILTIALSAGDAALMLYHPEWKQYELTGLALLASLGIHLQPMAYRQATIDARLGKK